MFKVLDQVLPAFTTGEDMFETEDKIPILVLLFRGGGDRVIEPNTMEHMPSGGTPDGRHHTIVGIVIVLGVKDLEGVGGPTFTGLTGHEGVDHGII